MTRPASPRGSFFLIERALTSFPEPTPSCAFSLQAFHVPRNVTGRPSVARWVTQAMLGGLLCSLVR